MDSIIKLIRSFNITTETLTALGILAGIFVFFVLWLIRTSILKFTTRICSRKKVKFGHLLLPTLLSTIFNFLLITVLSLILIKKDINPFYEIFKFALNLNYDANKFKIILLGFGAAELVFILAETFILKLVDVHPWYYIRLGILKLFKKEGKIAVLRENKPEKYNLTILNGLLSSIMSVLIILLVCVICILIGKYLGSTYFINFEL